MYGGARLAAVMEDIYGGDSGKKSERLTLFEEFNQMVFDAFLQ